MKHIIIFLVVATLCSSGLAVQFVFMPSPNIEVYQLAHYQCSVDHIGVNINWHVNGTGYGNNDNIIQLGIVTSGVPQHSNLTIYGYPQYNNTVVKCFAAGFVNGNSYFNFNESTLRIQGELAAVNNLICHVQSQYISCSWSSPFSLISIPGYIINITYGGELVTQNTTSSTTWQYCPSQFGTYTISVAGNNSGGEGEISTRSVEVLQDEITFIHVTPKRLPNGTYLANYIVETVYSLMPSSLSINITNSNGNLSILYEKIGYEVTHTFVGDINIDIARRQKWSITLNLRYNCRSLNSPIKMFSTFNVQRGSLTVKNSTIGEVCFTCYFLEGSQAQGCYIEFKCIRTDFNGNITIMGTPVDASTASKCVTGIYTSNYNVTFYDMDENNNIDMEEYAVKLTDQSVTALSLISTITSTLSTSSMTINIMSPSPTVFCIGCDNIRTVKRDHLIIIIVVTIIILIILAILVLLIVICAVLHRKKGKWMPEGEITLESMDEMSANQIKYIDVTQLSNGPIPAPNLNSTVPYSTVVSKIGQYNLRQQYQSSYSENEPSNEEYTRLNHNVHASTQLYDRTQQPHSHTSTPIPPMYSTLPTNGNMTSHISSPDSQYSTLSNKTSDELTINKTTELTHKDLVIYVAPHVTTKLREIGTALALTPSELDDIEENHQDITGVFHFWYETRDVHIPGTLC